LALSYVLKPRNETEEILLRPFESKIIQPDTTWYSAVDINTKDPSAIISYKFDSPPQLIEMLIEDDVLHQIVILAKEMVFYDFKLSVNSSLNISFHSSLKIEFTLIQGAQNFNLWKIGNSQRGVLQNVCTNNLATISMRFSQSDVYFLVFSNPNLHPIAGMAKISIATIVPDFTTYTDICKGEASCVLELQRGSEQCIMVLGIDPKKENFEFVTVMYKNYPRYEYFFMIVGAAALLNLILCALAVALYLILTRQKVEEEPVSGMKKDFDSYETDNEGSISQSEGSYNRSQTNSIRSKSPRRKKKLSKNDLISDDETYTRPFLQTPIMVSFEQRPDANLGRQGNIFSESESSLDEESTDQEKNRT